MLYNQHKNSGRQQIDHPTYTFYLCPFPVNILSVLSVIGDHSSDLCLKFFFFSVMSHRNYTVAGSCLASFTILSNLIIVISILQIRKWRLREFKQLTLSKPGFDAISKESDIFEIMLIKFIIWISAHNQQILAYQKQMERLQSRIHLVLTSQHLAQEVLKKIDEMDPKALVRPAS